MKRIIIHSKEDKFTLGDLSELCYNVNNIYKILVFDKENKKSLQYYYRAKLPEKDALLVDKISKASPFSLEVSSTHLTIIQILIGIIQIAIALRQDRSNQERKVTNQEINEEIEIRLREKNIKQSDELVAEIRKLSRRKIRIEEIREQ